jgi:ATP-dependent Clp protease ATP-binding subunit ClpC
MTRLDLSEYAEAHSIARIIGSPPGYIGHEAGGQLTESVRKRPYQVILLDEIEKAHRDVLEAFLQVFDEGRLTDGRGRTVDFTNTVLVLTSNLGADVAIAKDRGIGFRPSTQSTAARTDTAAVLAAAREALPPELYNRIDEVLAFSPLTRPEVQRIAEKMLEGLSDMIEASRGITLSVGPGVAARLLDLGGFDPELGARPMRRAIAAHVEGPVAEVLLRGVTEGDVLEVLVDEDGDGLVIVPAERRPLLARVPLASPVRQIKRKSVDQAVNGLSLFAAARRDVGFQFGALVTTGQPSRVSTLAPKSAWTVAQVFGQSVILVGFAVAEGWMSKVHPSSVPH